MPIQFNMYVNFYKQNVSILKMQFTYITRVTGGRAVLYILHTHQPNSLPIFIYYIGIGFEIKTGNDLLCNNDSRLYPVS